MDMTKEELANGYYKVNQHGGTFVVATFFNPDTGDVQTVVARDYDYDDKSRDNDWAYYMDIDQNARRIWLHANGYILEGDTVEVVKGRKIPVGTVAVVRKIYDWCDKYGRVQAVYALFEDGRKTNVENCRLVKEA